MKFYHYILASLAIAGAMTMTSCNDDDTYDVVGNPENLVFAHDYSTTTAVAQYPGGTSADLSWSTNANCNKPAESDILVTFAVDNSLIADYNEAHGTDYLAIPDGVLSIENPSVTIEAGKTSSTEKFRLSFVDDANALAKISDEKGYLIPVTVQSVEGANKANSVKSLSYIIVNVSYTLINETGDPKGTIIPKEDRQDWVATPGNGASEWWSWDYPIYYESGYSYGSYRNGATVTYDFGETKTFDGIHAQAYGNSTMYALLRAGSEILVSDDGSNWTSVGFLENTHTVSVAFYTPQTGRYLKVVLGNGTYVACTSFSIYAIQ